jgi:hypothetical protein
MNDVIPNLLRSITVYRHSMASLNPAGPDQAQMPSEITNSGGTNEMATQQGNREVPLDVWADNENSSTASTSPGTGTEVKNEQPDQQTASATQQTSSSKKVPFKEKVVGT